MKARFINLNRYYKQVLMVISDQLVLSFALSLAFILRFGDFSESLLYMTTNWWLYLLLPFISSKLSTYLRSTEFPVILFPFSSIFFIFLSYQIMF